LVELGFEGDEGEFSDDFDDGVADGWTVQLGNFDVVSGEYCTENGPGEKSITTVDSSTCTDCLIETNLRLRDTEGGFQAAIIFRYTDNEHHYTLSVNAEGDCIGIEKYTPANPHFGELLAANYSVSIDFNTDYIIGIRLQGSQFAGFLNGEQVITVTDDTYSNGRVGLRGQKADAFFDNFAIYSLP